MRVSSSRTPARSPTRSSKDSGTKGWPSTSPMTGYEAARKLDLYPYDVVVLDRDLPGMHGDTICRMITEGDHPAMVLMLTASDSPAQRVSGLGLGADDYVSKPFHLPELALRIRALARRRPAAHPRILRAAGIELDPLRRAATRDGRRLDLSAKEFAVLQDADARPGLPCSARKTCSPGLGRSPRPVQQHCPRHDQQAPTQARRTPCDHNDHQRRLPPGPEYRLGSARPCPCTHPARSASSTGHLRQLPGCDYGIF